jgi:hypothetical protein
MIRGLDRGRSKFFVVRERADSTFVPRTRMKNIPKSNIKKAWQSLKVAPV